MPGVLIYGFGPYMGLSDNVTEATIRILPGSVRAQRKVFEVRFDRRMFERTLERIRPSVVIGMGQHPRARKLRIERTARSGRRVRAVSLALPRTTDTTVTYDAGRYVCNYSMWVVQGWCAKHRARFAFLHVPRRWPPRKLAAYLGRCVSALRKDGASRSSRRGLVRSR